MPFVTGCVGLIWLILLHLLIAYVTTAQQLSSLFKEKLKVERRVLLHLCPAW